MIGKYYNVKVSRLPLVEYLLLVEDYNMQMKKSSVNDDEWE